MHPIHNFPGIAAISGLQYLRPFGLSVECKDNANEQVERRFCVHGPSWARGRGPKETIWKRERSIGAVDSKIGAQLAMIIVVFSLATGVAPLGRFEAHQQARDLIVLCVCMRYNNQLNTKPRMWRA